MLPAIDQPSPVHGKGVSETFREAREIAGLSQRELASILGTSSNAVAEIESNETELAERYSAADLQLMASALGVGPTDLLGCPTDENPITVEQLFDSTNLVERQERGGIADFEAKIGWRLDQLQNAPDLLRSDLTLSALQELCTHLHVDWQRVVKGL